MKRSRSRSRWGAALIAILCLLALALWQWQPLARLAIVALVQSAAGVKLSIGHSAIGWNQAVLEDVRVTSPRGEPIAEIARLRVGYDPRDWLLGGKRLFGLASIEADSPHVTLIKRADGTYNVPIPPQAQPVSGGPPLIAAARVTHGSIEIVNQRPQAIPSQRRLYVEDLDAAGDIAPARTRYTVTFRYGERPDRLYPVRGRGDVNPQEGYVNQRWTAPFSRFRAPSTLPWTPHRFASWAARCAMPTCGMPGCPLLAAPLPLGSLQAPSWKAVASR